MKTADAIMVLTNARWKQQEIGSMAARQTLFLLKTSSRVWSRLKCDLCSVAEASVESRGR